MSLFSIMENTLDVIYKNIKNRDYFSVVKQNKSNNRTYQQLNLCPAQTPDLELYNEGGLRLVRIKSEAPIMRHFTIGLERI